MDGALSLDRAVPMRPPSGGNSKEDSEQVHRPAPRRCAETSRSCCAGRARVRRQGPSDDHDRFAEDFDRSRPARLLLWRRRRGMLFGPAPRDRVAPAAEREHAGRLRVSRQAFRPRASHPASPMKLLSSQRRRTTRPLARFAQQITYSRRATACGRQRRTTSVTGSARHCGE